MDSEVYKWWAKRWNQLHTGALIDERTRNDRYGMMHGELVRKTIHFRFFASWAASQSYVFLMVFELKVFTTLQRRRKTLIERGKGSATLKFPRKHIATKLIPFSRFRRVRAASLVFRFRSKTLKCHIQGLCDCCVPSLTYLPLLYSCCSLQSLLVLLHKCSL